MSYLPKILLGILSVLTVFVFVACDQTESPVATENSSLSKAATTLPASGTEEARLEAELRATQSDPLASGTAKWEIRPDRVKFSTEVEDVTTSGNHEVRVNGAVIGSVNVVAGFGDLNLDSRDGDTVPTMNAGDLVQVRNPSGRVILRGRFVLDN
jgi:hypothetical protein